VGFLLVSFHSILANILSQFRSSEHVDEKSCRPLSVRMGEEDQGPNPTDTLTPFEESVGKKAIQ
jgi:hypothetical protein